MSYIAHRCTKCGHPDSWRRATITGPENCSCGCRCTPGGSEVLPTWKPNGQPSEEVVPPGDRERLTFPTCGCDSCKALHKQLTTA